MTDAEQKTILRQAIDRANRKIIAHAYRHYQAWLHRQFVRGAQLYTRN